MLMQRLIASMCSACLMACGASAALAQNYPNKPIRILAPEPGAPIDLTARLIAQRITPSLGQQVIVDNRTAIISVETAARASPDGYTLLFYTSTVWVQPLMQQMRYDAIRDFSPITLATNAPLFLFAHPAVPARSVSELIAYAKAKPGELNIGSAGTGTTNHLAAELLKSAAAIDLVRVPYKGTAQAVLGLVANQVQLVFASASAGMAQAKAGRLKVLGVASAKPSALAPDVPTIAASGLPGYEAASMSCVWAPAGTPRPVINRLNKEILMVLGDPEAQQKLLASGVEAIGGSPEQTAAYISADVAKWAKVIKQTGIRLE